MSVPEEIMSAFYEFSRKEGLGMALIEKTAQPIGSCPGLGLGLIKALF